MKYVVGKILLPLILLTSIFSVQAEILTPVTWSSEYEDLGNDEYLLKFTATIDDGWYVYSQFIGEDGPVPTTIFLADESQATFIGDATEIGDKVKEGYDEMFDMDIKKFAHKAVFTQKIKLLDKSKPLVAIIEFMTCDDTRCLPPDQPEFTFKLGGSTGSIEANDYGIDLGATETVDEAPAENSGLLQPVSWTLEHEKISDEEHLLRFVADIDDGWYVYSQFIGEDGPIPTSFNFEEGISYEFILQGQATETGDKVKEGFDEMFAMDIKKFAHRAVFEQKVVIKDPKARLQGFLEFMTCDDTRCLPPEQINFVADFGKGFFNVGYGPKPEGEVSSSEEFGFIQNLDSPVSVCGATEAMATNEPQEKKSLFGIFVLGFFGGLIALLTPCVFPMIPLTVSFFTKGGTAKGKGVFNAAIYGFFIFLIYVLLSIPFHLVDTLNPDILNDISTNVWLNLTFFVIFVVFAFSFFGYFELTMPAALTNKMDSASDVGGMVGIFFMAVTLALVSFSCTGPILGSLLAGALSSDGGAIQLSSGMAGFGLALALPFTLFAAFPSMLNALPKSGGWLNSVKVVIAFAELALAFKFLSNADLVMHWGLLKREIFFAIWILCSLGIVAYLMGWIKFPHDSPITKLSPLRIGTAVLVFAFALYLVPGLTNTEYANRKLLSGFPPPLFYSVYDKDTKCPLGLECYKDFDEGLEVAKATGKPIMIDFTGWACVNCRRMEENVWVDPEVYKLIDENYVLISLYVDDKTALPEDEQVTIMQANGQTRTLRTVGNKWSHFQTHNLKNNSQPYYALVNTDGTLLAPPVGYTPDADDYVSFLDCGLTAYNQLQATASK